MKNLPRILVISMVAISLSLGCLFAFICIKAIFLYAEPVEGVSLGKVLSDFVPHYSAAKLFHAGRYLDVYSPSDFHAFEINLVGVENFPFLPAAYPPFYYFYLSPLTVLDIRHALWVWVGVALIFIFILGRRLNGHWHSYFIVAFSPAIWLAAGTGQNGLYSAIFLAAGLFFLERRREFLAGAFFGALCYKPQLALSLPFFLFLCNHHRALFGMVVFSLAMLMVSLPFVGLDVYFSWLEYIPVHAKLVYGYDFENMLGRIPTVFSASFKLSGMRDISLVIHYLFAGAALTLAVVIWRRTGDWMIRSMALAATVPLVAPVCFDYDLAFTIIPVLLVERSIRKGQLGFGPLVALGLIALWWMPVALFLNLMPFGAPLGPLLWAAGLGFAWVRAASQPSERLISTT